MAPAIEVRDLVKRYRKGTVNAVDGVSFDVEQGQFFALLGPNGAGKTTTISILTTTIGLDTASRHNLWQYIRDLRKRQDITICLTTHQLDEAEDADRVCIIDHGRVIAMGAPHEVKSELVHETLHIDAADRSALRSRLHALNVPFSEDGHFVVRLDGRTAYEVVHAIDEPLTMLRTESATLEDAYLRLLAAEDA